MTTLFGRFQQKFHLFLRSLFRKSVLVGQHTMYWLGAGSHTPKTATILPKASSGDMETFESPIHRRFFALYSRSDQYSGDLSKEYSPLKTTTKEYDVSPLTEDETKETTPEKLPSRLDWWIYVPMTYVHATTLFPVSLFGWALAYINCHRSEVAAVSATIVSPTPTPTPTPKLCSEEAYNANIDPIFYDRTTLKSTFIHSTNELERAWLSRKLYVTTPRGNIMMHYDAFKEGFAYYGDQSGVPYRVLNALAMKYTMTFRCLDFFVDEDVLPGNPSPLIDLLYQEDTCEQTKKKNTMKQLLSGGKDGDDRNPFVKSRSNKLDVAQLYLPGTAGPSSTRPSKTTTATKEPRKNKFLYMGKLQNASWLQSIPKRVYYSVSAASIYEDVMRSDEIQRQHMSYKTYKTHKN